MNNDIKQAYVSTPVKSTVLLEKTKCDPVLQTRGATQFAPPFSCAYCVQLNHTSAFDNTARAASLSEPRPVDGLRYIRVLCIIDGTRVNDKVAVPAIALLYTRPSTTSVPPEIQPLAQLCGAATAVTFFFGFRTFENGACFGLEIFTP